MRGFTWPWSSRASYGSVSMFLHMLPTCARNQSSARHDHVAACAPLQKQSSAFHDRVPAHAHTLHTTSRVQQIMIMRRGGMVYTLPAHYDQSSADHDHVPARAHILHTTARAQKMSRSCVGSQFAHCKQSSANHDHVPACTHTLHTTSRAQQIMVMFLRMPTACTPQAEFSKS